MDLYREKYFDFNVQHFHAKFRDLHGIELSYAELYMGEHGAANSGTGKAPEEAGIAP